MAFCLSLLSFIGVIAIVFCAVDFYIHTCEFISRIHFGRWNERSAWREAIEKRALHDLTHLPIVPITDQSRLVLWDMIRGRFSRDSVQSWQIAGLLFGLEEKAREWISKNGHRLLSGENEEIDQLLLSYILQKLGCITETQAEFSNRLIASNLLERKTIPYRKNSPEIRYVDTIGLTCPYLHINGHHDLTSMQIKEYDDALFDGSFPAHAFHVKQKVPMGVYDWSRGIGWYILGLTEAHNQENEKRTLRLAYQLLKFQRTDGGFNCFVFNPKERFESSGTVLIGLLFIRSYEVTQDSVFLQAAQRAEKSLMKHTRRNGAIDHVQGDTKGIGKYSNKFSTMPFAQGMSLYFSKCLDKYLPLNENSQ